jgi:SsrA-binding protein
MAGKASDDRKVVADNRKARHNYEIGEVFEAGLVLTGSEVKSLRAGRATIAESYATDERGEIFLINATFPEYTEASRFNHVPKRPRKLLLRKREMAKLMIAIQREGMTLVPLQLYFNKRGIAKLALALAKGRKVHDKRDAIKQRDWDRQKRRVVKEGSRD